VRFEKQRFRSMRSRHQHRLHNRRGVGRGLGSPGDDSAHSSLIRDTNPTSDYTFPLISLVSGRKVGRLLRREFGERPSRTCGCLFLRIDEPYPGAGVRAPHGPALALVARLDCHSRRSAPVIADGPGLCRWRHDQQSTRSMSCGRCRWDDHRSRRGGRRAFETDIEWTKCRGCGPEEVAAAGRFKHQHHADSVASGMVNSEASRIVSVSWPTGC